MTKIFSETIDDVIAVFDYDFKQNGRDICSDLVVEVDDKGKITEYFAHRFVLSRRSPAFQSIIASLPLRNYHFFVSSFLFFINLPCSCLI
jgi:hypothetical protein